MGRVNGTGIPILLLDTNKVDRYFQEKKLARSKIVFEITFKNGRKFYGGLTGRLRKVSTKISPVKTKHFIVSKELRDGGILMKGPVGLVKGAFFSIFRLVKVFYRSNIFR